MKRLPILLTLVALIALAASVAYWILQLYKPAERPLAAAPVAALADPSMDAAATLFGGQAVAEVAANYTLSGVIADGVHSVAIISANGAPAKALVVGKELAPGVSVSEVHPRYVMLSDAGVMKRIDLAPDTKAAAQMGGGAVPPPPVPAPGGAVPEPQQDANAEATHGDVGAHDQPPPPPSAANPPLNTGPVPQAAQPQPQPPVQAPVQAPAPVTPPGSSVTPVGAPSNTAPVAMPQPIRSPNVQPSTNPTR